MKKKEKEEVNEDYLNRVVIHNPSDVDEKYLVRIASKSGTGHTGYGQYLGNSDTENLL